MKTLVFGGRGMLGHDLAELSTSENPVICLSRAEGDLSDQASIDLAIEAHQPDAVIVAGAWTDVDGAEANREACFDVNAEGPGRVGRACAGKHIPVLMVSTDYVFSKQGPEPHLADAPHDPLSVYGQSKSAGEHKLAASGCPWIVVRTSWLFGVKGKSFPDTMLKLAQGRDQLSVVDDQVGAPTFTGHLAVGLLDCLRKELRGNQHLCAEGSVSWCGFAKEVFLQTGVEIAVEPCTTDEFPRPALRPSWSVLSMKRTREAGIVLPSWQMGVRDWLLARSQS